MLPRAGVPSCVQRTLLIVFLVLVGWFLSGCSAGDLAPRFELVSARTVEQSDDGQVIALTIQGENANDHEVHLRNAQYRVTADGVQIFRGQRSAEIALPRYGRVNMEVLAAFPNDLVVSEINSIGITGSIEYLHPGPFAETLYDNRLRRPAVGLKGSVPLER